MAVTNCIVTNHRLENVITVTEAELEKGHATVREELQNDNNEQLAAGYRQQNHAYRRLAEAER